ncbi:Disordered region downstream of MFMR [Orobanche gracilis]
MGNSEEVKPTKTEKSSSPAKDQNNIHMYPDWATMQAAFYGSQFAVPPYTNSGVPSHHAPPPYMWAPSQSMMPAYGAPYSAFYAHGGVYAHPGVPPASTTLSMDAPVKSSGITDESFVKKLKEFDGLAMSIGNGNGDSTDPGTECRTVGSYETEGSSDGSNGVTPQAGQHDKNRSRQGSPNMGDGKSQDKSSAVAAVEIGRASENMMDVISAASTPVKTMENTNAALELKNVKSSPTDVSLQSMPNEACMQNERDLKREKRKQSNRESARRSRLRKQAEADELAVKVQSLTAENMNLKSEINKLMESSQQLKIENAALVEKLKLGQTEEMNLHKTEDQTIIKPVATANLLARVNNSDSSNNRRNNSGDGGGSHENRSPRDKLCQLLDASHRTDAMTAS